MILFYSEHLFSNSNKKIIISECFQLFNIKNKMFVPNPLPPPTG